MPISPEDVKAYGRYLLFRKLAEGGMAEIFLAKQLGEKGFEKNVVIKRMLGHLSAASDFVDMFLDEARIAAKLLHPNIVQINDFGQIDNRYFICMEYLPGEDFSTIVRAASKRREYVPLNVALRVIIDAANGLHFAHEFVDENGRPLNIVHRDISPSNIYVTFSGQVKVLDFGIAKAESRVTNTTAGVVKGKYMYMAPEQARGHEVDRRADVFSLGVSLFEVLTNTRPFGKDNDLAILNAVLKGDFPHPRQLRPDLPVELEAVILKAMAVNVADRYQSAHDFGADLERYLGSSTSASGGMQVGAYLKNLFGEDKVAQKTTRLPSLTMIAAAGVPIPGMLRGEPIKAEAATRAVEIVPVMDAPTRAGAPQPQKGGAGRVVAAAVISGLAVALGIVGFLFYKTQNPSPPAHVEAPVVTQPLANKVADPPSVAPAKVGTLWVAVVDADNGKALPGAKVSLQPALGDALPLQTGADGSVMAKDLPPGAAVVKVALAGYLPADGRAEVEAGRDGRLEIRAHREHRASAGPGGPITGGEIQKVVASHYTAMLSCFEKNRGELGSEQGTTQVQFTILGTGTVSNVEVQGSLSNAGAGRCLKQQFASLRFRQNPDQQVTLTLPFNWRVNKPQ